MHAHTQSHTRTYAAVNVVWKQQAMSASTSAQSLRENMLPSIIQSKPH